MIGVALVVFVAIFAASIKSTIEDTILNDFPADLTASSTNFEIGVSQAFTAELAEVEELETVSPLVFDSALVDDGGVSLIAVDPMLVGEVVNLEPAPGAFQALEGSEGVLVFDEIVDDNGWAIGDTIVMGFPNSQDTSVEIVGTFGAGDFGSYIVDRAYYNTLYDNPFDSLVFATIAPGKNSLSLRD